MVRHTLSVRVAFAAMLAATGLLIGSSLQAAPRPGRPAKSGPAKPTYTPLGETVFECGTYKGNEIEIKPRQAMHLQNEKQFEKGLKVRAAGLDYMYDNVWVIEDDGSLTISGTNSFDTDLQTHKYVDNGGGTRTVSRIAYSYDTALGTIITTGDDGAVLVNLPFAFPYAGVSYTQMYVSGNGAVSFGAVVNPNGRFESSDFFSSTPKIAAYFMDLDPSAGGTVRVRSEVTKYTVSWIGVPEYGTANSNTFQIVLYPSGSITITYNGIVATSPNGEPIFVGVHPGGEPPFDQIDLSSQLPHVSTGGAVVFDEYYNYPQPIVDEVALLHRFYTEFPDDFFQVVYFTNFAADMGGAFAYERNIQNDVTGIGQDIFDASDQYGSTGGTLESLCNLGSLGQWTATDPNARIYGKGNNFLTIMGQEAGHRWGAFVFFDKGAGWSPLLLGRSNAHWSYYADVDHSALEGGDWESAGGSNFSCPTNIDFFSEIDEYLFGLRTANEVKDIFYISSASNNQSLARSVGTPIMGATATGTLVSVTVEDIIAAEGPRTPLEANEAHDLRQAFIFLIAQGTAPSQAELDKVVGFRNAWEPYFEKSCDGRLSCNTSLTAAYDVGVISGEVRDRHSQNLVPEFTAKSVERSFTQHVPADGRFIFRYDDGPAQGASEPVTLIFTAPGYYPDTLTTAITYGTTQHLVGLADGIWLTPIATAAGDLPVPTDLGANHPNPFNPTTTIDYMLGEAGRVQITVFDATGHRVRTLVDRTESRGDHRVTFDGRDDRGQPLASGIYLYRLEAGNVSQTRKMVLLK